MKLFALLAMSMALMCSMGFAQNSKDLPQKANKSLTFTATTDFSPTTDVPLQVNSILPLGTLSNAVGFSLLPNDLNLKVNHPGHYLVAFTSLLSENSFGSIGDPDISIFIEFSKNRRDWRVLYSQLNFQLNCPVDVTVPIFVPAKGFLRLRVVSFTTNSRVYSGLVLNFVDTGNGLVIAGNYGYVRMNITSVSRRVAELAESALSSQSNQAGNAD